MVAVEVVKRLSSVGVGNEAWQSFVPNIESLRAEIGVKLQMVEKEREQVVGGVTVREVWLERDGLYYRDSEGKKVNYQIIMQTSQQEFAGEQVLVERFRAEGVGWGKAAEMLQEIDENEVVVIVSPPGEVYREGDRLALSATFVLQKVGSKYAAYATYVPEIEEERHADIFGLPGEMETNELVQSPVVMKQVEIDAAMAKLGFAGWREIERRAVNLDEKLIYQERLVYQAIIDLRHQFDTKTEGKFWKSFEKMVLDLVMKDVRGELVGLSAEEIKKTAMIYLNESLAETGGDLGWLLVEMGVGQEDIDEWRVRQEWIQQQEWYQMGWGSHGNAMEIPDFGQKGDHFDARTNRLVDARAREAKNTVTCSCGRKIEARRVPCNCPACGKRVAAGKKD